MTSDDAAWPGKNTNFVEQPDDYVLNAKNNFARESKRELTPIKPSCTPSSLDLLITTLREFHARINTLNGTLFWLPGKTDLTTGVIRLKSVLVIDMDRQTMARSCSRNGRLVLSSYQYFYFCQRVLVFRPSGWKCVVN